MNSFGTIEIRPMTYHTTMSQEPEYDKPVDREMVS
jgi:hypothetical protein